MNNEQIIQEAKSYINSDKTIDETAKDLRISTRTLQLHLGKLKIIDPKLHELVLDKKEKMQIKGRIKGGQIGKVSPSYTKEKAENVAHIIIEKEYTYEEASKVLGIPKSTIYEMVHSPIVNEELKNMLDAVAVANTKGLTVDELISRNKRGNR